MQYSMNSLRAEKLVLAVGQLHDFIVPLEDEVLVYISRYVLRRPADCLTKLKRRLQERMISHDNDTAPRLWSSPTTVGLGLLYSAMEGAVNLQYTTSNPSGEEKRSLPQERLRLIWAASNLVAAWD